MSIVFPKDNFEVLKRSVYTLIFAHLFLYSITSFFHFTSFHIYTDVKFKFKTSVHVWKIKSSIIIN